MSPPRLVLPGVNTPVGGSVFKLQPHNYHQCPDQDWCHRDNRCEHPSEGPFPGYDPITTTNVTTSINAVRVVVGVNTPWEAWFSSYDHITTANVTTRISAVRVVGVNTPVEGSVFELRPHNYHQHDHQ